MGREWMQKLKFGITQNATNQIQKVEVNKYDQEKQLRQLLEEFSDIFEAEVGRIPG